MAQEAQGEGRREESHCSRGSDGSQVGVVLQEVFLHLGQDMFTVGVFS